MSKFADLGFDISFTSSCSMDEEPDNYLITIEGKIHYLDDRDRKHVVGKLQLFLADLEGASQDGYDPFDILDTRSETADFFSVLFNSKTLEFKDTIYQSMGGDIYSTNLLRGCGRTS